jgi:putative glycosyltransferase (TIGR04372 family)
MSGSYNLLTFIMRQIRQLLKADWSLWKRKLKLLSLVLSRLPIQLIAFLPALILVLTARLIRPIFLIRFENFISNRIGHFALNIEQYLCELDAGINIPKTRFFDIWYHSCTPCNYQLARMWKRVLHIGPAILFELVGNINDVIPGGELHRIDWSIVGRDRDVHNLLDKFPPHISFLPNEERRGKMGLRSLGIPDDAPFVCLTVRDSAYLNDQSPHLDWSRHNFRNCDIQNYILVSRKLAERGYYVIRIGAVVKEAMDVDHPMIIDYATNGMRSDFMDIYLGAKCTFCISTSLGFDSVPIIFRRPVVFVDSSPLEVIRTWSIDYISTFKKYWKRDEDRFMTFQEIFESGAGKFTVQSEFEALGIDLVESTPEEIADVVLEMDERLRGVWKSTQEDERLQQSFWEMFPRGFLKNASIPLHGEIYSRVGVEFLRQHREWLE